ncbi:MAG: GntR family transcriptional regulator [Gammaproteobacteria bacterium]|nr:GntR family transcriptional regulator [Gammaproteobacteria bacterium]
MPPRNRGDHEPGSVEAITPRPLHIEVADRLRDLITQGELAAGDRLNERLLAERFTISRTPLREAIRMLAAEGLVRLLPNRGAVVCPITLADARDMFEVMAALEALAGELACKRATDGEIAEIAALHDQMRIHHEKRDLKVYFRFNQCIHQKIIDCAGNAELTAIYRRVSVRLRRPRYMANLSKERWDQAMGEHEKILEALIERDQKRLKALLAEHLKRKFEVIEDGLATEENAAEAGAGE